jgi:hypothetical protein
VSEAGALFTPAKSKDPQLLLHLLFAHSTPREKGADSKGQVQFSQRNAAFPDECGAEKLL